MIIYRYSKLVERLVPVKNSRSDSLKKLPVSDPTGSRSAIFSEGIYKMIGLRKVL